ncbi:MAG: hypothetical protein Q9213_000138 [Squamulea squamosa]
MATAFQCPPIHNVRRLWPAGLRAVCTTPLLASGHNRWSKIKHDKIKEDAVRSRDRSQWANNIQASVKSNIVSGLFHYNNAYMWVEHGGDPSSNSELSTLMAQAKKAGLPKSLIERAIAKGKGLSLSGEPLQSVTVEAMLPPSVSTIIECQTDNKKRTLEGLRLLVKEAGGMVTTTSHLFERRGHIILASEHEMEEERVMDAILEAGALDWRFSGDRKSVSIWTEPNETASLAQSLSTSLGLRLDSAEIIWVARPESVINVEDAEEELPLHEIIGTLQHSSNPFLANRSIDRLEGDPSVLAVYHNAMPSDATPFAT